MSLLIVTLRLFHILFGMFWAGSLVFFATFLVPSVKDVGPDGAKVMAALQRRRLLDVMPVVAALTILSGLWLYWRLSAGFNTAWVTSRFGAALSLGGLLSIVAFGIGVAVMRPAALRAAALAQRLATSPEGPDRTEQLAVVQRLRQRSATAGRFVAMLLILATASMAVARYL
jgi:uncharacterized membrane protein